MVQEISSIRFLNIDSHIFPLDQYKNSEPYQPVDLAIHVLP